jgi:phosphinothricin acetyltransferase
MLPCTIRPASGDDAATIAAIYGYFVRTSTATFETEPPDTTEMIRRIEAVNEIGLPWLVARRGLRVIGFAYANRYRPRPAYRFTVEDTIYVDPAFAGRGIGNQLLTALIENCRRNGAKQMIAAVGGDNPASIALHTSLGFLQAGVLSKVGFKFNQWIDLTLMQKPL